MVNQMVGLALLEKCGYQADTVADGNAVLEALSLHTVRHHFDGLPDAGDGWLRSDPGHP